MRQNERYRKKVARILERLREERRRLWRNIEHYEREARRLELPTSPSVREHGDDDTVVGAPRRSGYMFE